VGSLAGGEDSALIKPAVVILLAKQLSCLPLRRRGGGTQSPVGRSAGQKLGGRRRKRLELRAQGQQDRVISAEAWGDGVGHLSLEASVFAEESRGRVNRRLAYFRPPPLSSSTPEKEIGVSRRFAPGVRPNLAGAKFVLLPVVRRTSAAILRCPSSGVGGFLLGSASYRRSRTGRIATLRRKRSSCRHVPDTRTRFPGSSGRRRVRPRGRAEDTASRGSPLQFCEIDAASTLTAEISPSLA